MAEPFLNCERVHPLQQKKVQIIISNLRQQKEVEKIIVFGSSVRRDCHVGSDVDIYVILRENVKPAIGTLYFPYDLWTNYNVEPAMLEEINQKGVVVYVRDQ